MMALMGRRALGRMREASAGEWEDELSILSLGGCEIFKWKYVYV